MVARSLILCVLGNPFHPAALDPAWLAWNDGAIPKLAQVIYEERAFDRLPILADALEEAGCTDAAILDQCRFWSTRSMTQRPRTWGPGPS